jgi:hypothetical protein
MARLLKISLPGMSVRDDSYKDYGNGVFEE